LRCLFALDTVREGIEPAKRVNECRLAHGDWLRLKNALRKFGAGTLFRR
jgi:hypothetical protein